MPVLPTPPRSSTRNSSPKPNPPALTLQARSASPVVNSPGATPASPTSPSKQRYPQFHSRSSSSADIRGSVPKSPGGLNSTGGGGAAAAPASPARTGLPSFPFSSSGNLSLNSASSSDGGAASRTSPYRSRKTSDLPLWKEELNRSFVPTADVGRPFREPGDFEASANTFGRGPSPGLPSVPKFGQTGTALSNEDADQPGYIPPPSSSSNAGGARQREPSQPFEGEFARQRREKLQAQEEAKRLSESQERSYEARRFRRGSFFGSDVGPAGGRGAFDDAEDAEERLGGGEEVDSGIAFGRLGISTAPSNPTTVPASSLASPYSATAPGSGGLRHFSSAGPGGLPPGAAFVAPQQARQSQMGAFQDFGYDDPEGGGGDLDRRNSFFGPSAGAPPPPGSARESRRNTYNPGLPPVPSFPNPGGPSGPGDRQVRTSASHGKLRKDRPGGAGEKKDRVVSEGHGHSRGDSFFGLPASSTTAPPPGPGQGTNGNSAPRLPPLTIPHSPSTNFSRPSGQNVNRSSTGPSAPSPTIGGPARTESPRPGFAGQAGFSFGGGSPSQQDRDREHAASANGGPTSFYGLDRPLASAASQGILPSSSSGSGSGSGSGGADATARHDRGHSSSGGPAGIGAHRSSSPAGTASWGQGSGSGSVSASIGSRGLTRESRPGSLYNEPGYMTNSTGSGSGAGGPGGNAPYQYGGPSRTASVMMQPPVQVQSGPLLDHSHLQPGNKAKLLDYTKTLELYRANAKKTNDPAVMFEFACFLMDVVKEMGDEDNEAKSDSGSSKENKNTDGKLSKPGAAKRKTSGPGMLERPTIGGTTVPSSPQTRKEHEKADLIAESIALLQKLATRGHVDSQFLLADCYTQAIGTPKGKRDFDKAFPLFVLAAKHGHTEATFRAGQCCENGWGTRKEKDKAVTFYRKAAVAQFPPAMYRLGLAEMNGDIGLSKKPKEGVKWLKRAAEAADESNPKPLHELALLHERGIDNVLFVDYEYAAELLARAAELQYAPSAYKLGECYEYGRMGCPQDSALSIHYYNIAAQLGHREACFALTAWYLVGSPGVLPQSDTEAYLWAKKAAELNLAKAEYAVGYFTEVGIGTVRDPRDAVKWFKRAAEHGDKRAVNRLRSGALPGVGPGYGNGNRPDDQTRRHKEYIGREMDQAKKAKGGNEDCVIM